MRVTSYFNGEVWMTGEVIAFLPDRIAVVKNDANGFLSTLDINSLKVIENDNELDRVDKLKQKNERLVEALKFYENCSSLMLKQRDLPIDPVLGRSVLTEKHIQDNGDVARQILKEIGEE